MVLANWDQCTKRQVADEEPNWDCEVLPLEIQVECSGIGCTWERVLPNNIIYNVHPVGAGEISIRVLLTRTDTGEEFVWEGGPYVIATPDRYVATCTRGPEGRCDVPAPRDTLARIRVEAWTGDVSFTFTPEIETDADATLAYEVNADATPPQAAYMRVAIIRFQDVVSSVAGATIRHGDWEQEFTFLLE